MLLYLNTVVLYISIYISNIFKCNWMLLQMNNRQFYSTLIKHFFFLFVLFIFRFKLLIQDENMGNKMYKGIKYVLKIIELNVFKNLCHLSIEMSKASDADVAKNICKKMTEIKVNATI